MKVRDERGDVGWGVILFGFIVLALVLGGTLWALRSANKELSSMIGAGDQYMNAWENGKVTQGTAEKVGDYTSIGERLTGKETYIVLVRYTVDGTEYSNKYLVDSKAFEEIDGADQDGKGSVEVHYDPADPSFAMIEAAVTSGKVLLEA